MSTGWLWNRCKSRWCQGKQPVCSAWVIIYIIYIWVIIRIFRHFNCDKKAWSSHWQLFGVIVKTGKEISQLQKSVHLKFEFEPPALWWKQTYIYIYENCLEVYSHAYIFNFSAKRAGNYQMVSWICIWVCHYLSNNKQFSSKLFILQVIQIYKYDRVVLLDK